MAITGISYSTVKELVSKRDDAYHEDLETARENGATIFRWRAIPNAVMTRIADMQAQSQMQFGDISTQTFNARTNARNRDAFRYGVIGIDNFKDEEGNAIKFTTQQVLEGGVSMTVVSDATMDGVPINIMGEIGSAIFNQNSMTENERKKLEGALSRFDGSDTSNVESVTEDNASNADANSPQDSSQTIPAALSADTGPTPAAEKTKTAAQGD